MGYIFCVFDLIPLFFSVLKIGIVCKIYSKKKKKRNFLKKMYLKRKEK